MSGARATAGAGGAGTSGGERDWPVERDWPGELTGSGRRRESAVADLHALLLRVAHRDARRRAAGLGLQGPEVEDLAVQATGDALVAILAKLAEFRGESRFTTWACGFVVRNVGVAVNRHFWTRHVPVPDETAWERLPDRFGVSPEEANEAGALFAALARIVREELTERQRTVFLALVVHGMPVDELAAQEGSSRNTLYKVMFDARRKIRGCLVAQGWIADTGRPGRSA